jgi:hypothetical protein
VVEVIDGTGVSVAVNVGRAGSDGTGEGADESKVVGDRGACWPEHATKTTKAPESTTSRIRRFVAVFSPRLRRLCRKCDELRQESVTVPLG